MDPLTAILNILTVICRIHEANLAAATPADRAALVHLQVEDLKAWRAFFDKFKIGP